MSIFNSLGSNYNLSYSLKSLFLKTSSKDLNKLKDFLSEKYSGKPLLFYKGREALSAALEILHLDHDSQVAVNGFTCLAVFEAIKKTGLTPALVDLSETGGLNFTAKSLEDVLKKNKKIKAVVIQNTLGYPCDIKAIEKICKENSLTLIEDLAHCIGTKYEDGREAGTVGDLIILSFSQDKIIDAISGGALVIRSRKYQANGIQFKTNSSQQVKDRFYPVFTYKIRKLYSVGLGKPYHLLLKKGHFMSNIMDQSFYDYKPLPPFNAHLALSEFKKLREQLLHRREIAKIYLKSLPESLFMYDYKKTKTNVDLSANLRFPIFVEKRTELLQKLKAHRIFLSDIWYVDIPASCPNAVKDSKMILNLPTHRNVSYENADKICQIISSHIKI